MYEIVNILVWGLDDEGHALRFRGGIVKSYPGDLKLIKVLWGGHGTTYREDVNGSLVAIPLPEKTILARWEIIRRSDGGISFEGFNQVRGGQLELEPVLVDEICKETGESFSPMPPVLIVSDSGCAVAHVVQRTYPVWIFRLREDLECEVRRKASLGKLRSGQLVCATFDPTPATRFPAGSVSHVDSTLKVYQLAIMHEPQASGEFVRKYQITDSQLARIREWIPVAEPAPTPPPALKKSPDHAFFDALGAEDDSKLCRAPGCNHGVVRFSVYCRRHHFENIRGYPCPFKSE